MSEVRTFWCEPAGLYRHELIVLDSNGPCTVCSARVTIADRTEAPDVFQDLPPASDPRWPKTCVRCGNEFGVDWTRSSGRDEYYRGAPDAELHTRRELLPGATWDAQWTNRTGPDGISLCVKLPNGIEWLVDGPASNDPTGKPWTRSGDPRQANVTARPSIGAGKAGDPGYYHGFLTNGVLVACGDSKT